MPQVEFEIDPETGELKAHVQGVQGPSCGDVQKLLEQLLGAATSEEKTPEFYQKPVTRQRIQR